MIIREETSFGSKLKNTCEKLVKEGKFPVVLMSSQTLELLSKYSKIRFDANGSILIDGKTERDPVNDYVCKYHPDGITFTPCYIENELSLLEFMILIPA